MKKNLIQHVIIHIPDNMDDYALSDKINHFHMDVIEQKLESSHLSKNEKAAVIDKIIENLKLQEIDGIIK